MIPDMSKYPIKSFKQFNELCYIIDTFNSYIKQTKKMSSAYQFLQNVKNGYGNVTSRDSHMIKYDISNIDEDIRKLQVEMPKIAITRTDFVKENTGSITDIVGSLRYFIPKKDTNTGLYVIYYCRYRDWETFSVS